MSRLEIFQKYSKGNECFQHCLRKNQPIWRPINRNYLSWNYKRQMVRANKMKEKKPSTCERMLNFSAYTHLEYHGKSITAMAAVPLGQYPEHRISGVSREVSAIQTTVVIVAYSMSPACCPASPVLICFPRLHLFPLSSLGSASLKHLGREDSWKFFSWRAIVHMSPS